MKRKFESKDCTYDVEIFQCGNTDIVRFYEERNEQYGETLTDLVIAAPSYGFLLIQHIAGEAVLTGTLDSKYFHMFTSHTILILLQYLPLWNIMGNIDNLTVLSDDF